MSRTLLILAACGGLALTGCGGTVVDRVDTDTVIDLTEEWNDIDSKQTAEAMIADALTFPWANDFYAENGRKPRIRLSPDEVRVRVTGDVIAKEIFLNDIRREFIRSGKATVVSSTDEASATRNELADQQINASEETRKEQRQETGADFILHGNISSEDQYAGKRAVRFYSVDLFLTNVQTREQVWAGNHKIKKDVENPSMR